MSHPWLLHLALVAGVLAMLSFAAHILRQRRHPAATLGWLLFMLLLPWFAVPLYLAIGTRKLAPRRIAVAAPRPCTSDDAVDRLLAHAGIAPAGAERVQLHADGAEAWQALFDLAGGARTTLDVELFILAADARGDAFMTLLAERARAGVRVRLLIDGIGSLRLARTRLTELRAAGVDIAWFIPLLHRPLRGRTNLRNHRKLVVADGTRAWMGGRNVAEEYFAADTEWTDLSLVVEGEAAAVLAHGFERDWRFAVRAPAPAAPTPSAGARLAVLPAGPDQPGDTLHDVLMTACYTARRRIVAVTPYFVPDEALLQALCLAARRGVEVRLILPARSNHRLADWVRARALRELAAAGASIRYVPGAMVHAKALLFDDTLGVAGSANLDIRSLFLNFELVLLLRAPADVAALDAWCARLDARADDARLPHAGPLREAAEGLVLLAAFQI
ncbi:MAG: phospholipase D-like domain-containing protein [Thiobacillus sp.]